MTVHYVKKKAVAIRKLSSRKVPDDGRSQTSDLYVQALRRWPTDHAVEWKMTIPKLTERLWKR